MKDTQPLMIVSTGRTGTIFFARLLAELYPQVSSHHEYGWSRPVQILSNMYFAGLIPKSLLLLGWKVFKGKDLLACPKPFWVENNSFLYGLIAVAPELYPQCARVAFGARPAYLCNLAFEFFQVSSDQFRCQLHGSNVATQSVFDW
jgi:hypothetical protein